MMTNVLEQRLASYEAIEKRRERPLVVYATSTRPGVQAKIAGDAVREFIDQIDAVPQSERRIDVLIHSAGGDPLAAWKIMSLLRERFDDVGVLVPSMAFSAATLFSLGANEIVMHPHASLGPIDPQITMPQKDGRQFEFSYEDVGAFLRFVKREVGLTEQTHVSTIFEKLFATIDPVGLGFAHRASELSTDVGERLLKLHMADGQVGKPDARTIAERLNKAFFAHGDAVSRRRARELGLKVADQNPDLERLMWDAFVAIEAVMQLRSQFNALEHFLSESAAASSLAPPAPLLLPPNTPPQIAQQAWQAAANAALQTQAAASPQVEFELFHAIMESTRSQRVYAQRGAITATRVGLDVKVGLVTKKSGWEAFSPGQSPSTGSSS